MDFYGEELDRLTEAEIARGGLTGASLAVRRGGALLYRRDYGEQSAGVPMRSDAIFRMYSNSKPITSAAAMLLLERGVLAPDVPVSDYLPGFAAQRVQAAGGQTVTAARRVTVRDLLNMTSGICYPGPEDAAGQAMECLFNEGKKHLLTADEWTTAQLAEKIGGMPLAFQPGAQWRYGASADVLGAVIEAASGMRFGAFLQKELFTPLEMPDTAFYVPREKQPRLVVMQQYTDGHFAPYKDKHLLIIARDTPPAFESGGAGLFSTVEDYAHFDEMLLAGGVWQGRRILKKETVRAMHQNQLGAAQLASFNWPQMAGYGYGNLLRVALDPAKTGGSAGEYGWDGWAGAYAEIDPARALIFEMFISEVGADSIPFRCALRRAVYAQLDHAGKQQAGGGIEGK